MQTPQHDPRLCSAGLSPCHGSSLGAAQSPLSTQEQHTRKGRMTTHDASTTISGAQLMHFGSHLCFLFIVVKAGEFKTNKQLSENITLRILSYVQPQQQQQQKPLKYPKIADKACRAVFLNYKALLKWRRFEQMDGEGGKLIQALPCLHSILSPSAWY